MKPRTLPIDIPILELVKEIFYTLALLRAYPFLQTQAAQLEALVPEWRELLQEELGLMLEQFEVEARLIVVDDKFDFLCVAIASTLLAESGGDRKSPMYLRYFEEQPPSLLKRPVLGNQLETMRKWPPSLTASGSAALERYGTQLAGRVVEADGAVAAMSESERKRADFEIGQRKAFIDKLNAVRQSIYGQLAEMPHKHPEEMLPRDFAHRFFLRTTNPRSPTVADVEQTILRLRERLRKQEELLARLVEEEEREARLREDAEVAAMEREAAEAERKAQELQERLAAFKQQRKTTPKR